MIKKNSQKGQISLEFIIMVSFVFLFLIIFLYLISEYRSEKMNEETYQISQELIYSIQNEVIIAESVHTGYIRQFTIPDEINGNNYRINNTATSIDLEIKNYHLSTNIPRISGTIKKGQNTLKKDASNITIT